VKRKVVRSHDVQFFTGVKLVALPFLMGSQECMLHCLSS